MTDQLVADVIQFIDQTDTAYIATSYPPPPEGADTPMHQPSRGRPGFVRLHPREGRAKSLMPSARDVVYYLLTVRPKQLDAVWREAEEKRAEKERSRLADKVAGWAKEVTHALPL